jgi:threonyl-tRNA synthetase
VNDIDHRVLGNKLDLFHLQEEGAGMVFWHPRGAFYGPKLEFHLTDSRERRWQCGTIQLDFVLPERLDAEFVNERNERERPVMIHHAVLGSMERFIAMLLEHHEGWLPMWLAPEQVVVATISDANTAYAREMMQALDDGDIRAGSSRRLRLRKVSSI